MAMFLIPPPLLKELQARLLINFFLGCTSPSIGHCECHIMFHLFDFLMKGIVFLTVSCPTTNFGQWASSLTRCKSLRFVLVWPKGHWEPRSEVGSKNTVEHPTRPLSSMFGHKLCLRNLEEVVWTTYRL